MPRPEPRPDRTPHNARPASRASASAQPAGMACALPLPLPQTRREQLVLLLFRRMATHGPRDARATMLALDQFGSGFLRPLHLVRAFLHGLVRHAQEPLRVAHCCAPRMTRHEGLVVAAMVQACPVALLELAGPEGYGDLQAIANALRMELAG